MNRAIAAVGLAALLAMPGIGRAAGVLYSFGHSNTFPEPLNVDCAAQNFNSTPQSVFIEALDIGGNVTTSLGPVTVPPGTLFDLPITPLGSNPPPNVVTCRYTLGGSVKKWRAGAVVYGRTDNVLRAVVDAK